MKKIIKDGRQATVVPDMDIVAGNSLKFKEEMKKLLNEDITHITVDLSNVELVDSSCIGTFISTQNSLDKVNGKLKAVNLSSDIFKIFKIMRLDTHFEVTGKN
ncbi:MAG: anti-sigma factor antagonist [Bacteroidia bacterium]|nr:anti-sigma factor antagonist [Bacteroidia bacterium]